MATTLILRMQEFININWPDQWKAKADYDILSKVLGAPTFGLSLENTLAISKLKEQSEKAVKI